MFTNPMAGFNQDMQNLAQSRQNQFIQRQNFIDQQADVKEQGHYRNAMVDQMQKQLPGAAPQLQNFGSVQAVQKHASDIWNQYLPAIQSAMQVGNNDVKNTIADTLIGTGNPILVQNGETLKKTEFLENKQIALPIEVLRTQNPAALAKYGLTPEAVEEIPDGSVGTFSPGRGGMLVATDWKMGKPIYDKTTAKFLVDSPAKKAELLMRDDIDDTVKESIRSVTPGKGVTVKLMNKKDGVFMGSDLGGLPKESGSLSGKLGSYVWASTGIPGVSRNRQTNEYVVRETQADGSIKNRPVSADEMVRLARGFKEGQAAAGQAGGAKTAALYRAQTLFDSIAPKLKAWKANLKEEDKQRLLPLVTDSKSINELTNKIESSFRDNPKQALLLKNTVLLADALSTVYGAGPGGQWSFEVAKAMLDPMPGPESFNATLDSHGEKIRESLASAKQFPQSVPIPREIIGGKTPYKVGDSYKGRIIKRIGRDDKSGKRFAILEGAKAPVELK